MDKNIKIASVEDISFILNLAKTEGWNPGIEDALAFHIADPMGFYIYSLHDKPVGCISIVRYAKHYSFLGLYIVLADYRHQNIGTALWKNALHPLKNDNIGLDGVVSQQKNYQKSGFQLAHRNIRFGGVINTNKASSTVDGRGLPFDLIWHYIENFFPTTPSFVAAWIGLKSHHSRALLIDGVIKGFGVLRKCVDGYKIGPLFAENTHYAETLLLDLCALTEKGDNVFIDVPEPNLAGIQLAQSFSLKPVFETARMYTKNPLNINLNQVFGITTFELG